MYALFLILLVILIRKVFSLIFNKKESSTNINSLIKINKDERKLIKDFSKMGENVIFRELLILKFHFIRSAYSYLGVKENKNFLNLLSELDQRYFDFYSKEFSIFSEKDIDDRLRFYSQELQDINELSLGAIGGLLVKGEIGAILFNPLGGLKLQSYISNKKSMRNNLIKFLKK